MTRFVPRRTLVLAVLSLLALLVPSGALRAAPPGGGGGNKGTILGEVVGASGPIAGASVLLFDGIAIDQVAETFSDANGVFEFRRVPEGTYTVTAISWSPPCSGSATVNVVAKKISVVVIACD